MSIKSELIQCSESDLSSVQVIISFAKIKNGTVQTSEIRSWCYGVVLTRGPIYQATSRSSRAEFIRSGGRKYKRHRKGGHKSLQKILGSDINQQQLFSSNIAPEHFLFVALKSALANGI